MAIKFLNGADLVNTRIVNLADPSAATDAANRQFVENFVNGLNFKDEVRVATTADGVLATAFAAGQSIDGVTLVAGDRILVKNQSTASANGPYLVQATGAPVRAADADTAGKLRQATVRVAEGTALANTQWTCSTQPIVLGTTPLVFANSSGTPYVAGNGLALATNSFSVQANGSTIDVSGSGIRVGPGAAGAGLVEALGVLAVGAGTGITVTADSVSIDTSVVTRRHSQAYGDGTAVSFTITHGLGTVDVDVTVRDSSTGAEVIVENRAATVNTVVIDHAAAPAAGAFRVTVVG